MNGLSYTTPKSRKDYNDDEGIFLQEKYITEEELKNSELIQRLLLEKLDKNASVNFAKIDGKFDLLESKIDNLSNSIPLIMDTKINEFKEESEKKHTETIRFIWGTMVIGVVSVIVAVISLLK